MNALSSLLAPARILLDLDVSSKKRLFEQTSLLFENHRRIARATVFDSLFARERLGSTGLGHGVAIPHGRIKGLREPAGAFVRLKVPVPFEAPDGKPVVMAFVLLVPEHANQRHLDILSELAEMFSDRDMRAKLSVETDAETVCTLISTWHPYAPNQRSAAG
jgi:PTS system nitrogen regulatory IIA component